MGMFKILVADDEKFIRKGIVSILSGNLREEVIFVEARNGLEALEKSRTETPGLIITDISMPGCDGLEFIQRMKEINVNVPVIILSGYENFEYAKKAIKLGVKEYVMKPIKKNEFVELIHSYIADIRQAQQRNREEYLKRSENIRIMEKLKRDFLLGLLKCTSSEEARNYLIQLKELGMSFDSHLYMCVAVQYKVTPGNQEYIDFVVKNILDEFWGLRLDDEKVVNVVYSPGMVVAIFEGESQNALLEQKKKLVRDAVTLLKQYCKTDIYAGIGDVAFDSVQLHVSLRHAMLAAGYKIFEEGDMVCVYQELENGKETEAPELVKRLKPIEEINIFDMLDRYRKLAYSGKTRRVLKVLEHEYEEVQNHINLVMSRKQTGKPVWDEKYKSFSCIWSVGEAGQELKERIELLKELYDDSGGVNEALMRQMLDFVDEHITEELDLNTVAEKFHRTSGYVSTLFKKYTSGGFSAYLTGERIKIARKLLEDSSIPIQEIGELCGYNNPKYFSVVFKKVTGETPRGYREKLISR
ncbi:response regulator transcription factor [[Clostridium] hylemonae]|uniref:response regulator transcription factor n=2 Tax=[Clostridium] hylemonae TaxID=89153 RepID=UPI0011072F32|nr:response regulator [[Clostridium] hylemonae]